MRFPRSSVVLFPIAVIALIITVSGIAKAGQSGYECRCLTINNNCSTSGETCNTTLKATCQITYSNICHPGDQSSGTYTTRIDAHCATPMSPLVIRRALAAASAGDR